MRKQINIDIEQDEVLKRLAEERRVSESELVREAIDLLVQADRATHARIAAVASIEELWARWDTEAAAGDGFAAPTGYRLGCYDE